MVVSFRYGYFYYFLHYVISYTVSSMKKYLMYGKNATPASQNENRTALVTDILQVDGFSGKLTLLLLKAIPI